MVELELNKIITKMKIKIATKHEKLPQNEQNSKEKKRRKFCLQSVPVQLLDSDLHRRIRTVNLSNPNRSSVNASEASLADHQRAAEPARCRSQLGEPEHAQIVGSALREEIDRAGHRGSRGIGEVPGLGLELGAPGFRGAGGDAERSDPGDLGNPRNGGGSFVVFFSGEVEALHDDRV